MNIEIKEFGGGGLGGFRNALRAAQVAVQSPFPTKSKPKTSSLIVAKLI